MKREQGGLKRRISIPLRKAGDHDIMEARKKCLKKMEIITMVCHWDNLVTQDQESNHCFWLHKKSLLVCPRTPRQKLHNSICNFLSPSTKSRSLCLDIWGLLHVSCILRPPPYHQNIKWVRFYISLPLILLSFEVLFVCSLIIQYVFPSKYEKNRMGTYPLKMAKVSPLGNRNQNHNVIHPYTS